MRQWNTQQIGIQNTKRIMNSRIGHKWRRRTARCAALLCLLASLLWQPAEAQCPNWSTSGRDFWVMFLQNYSINDGLSLVATGPVGAQVRVRNQRLGLNQMKIIGSSGVVSFDISATYGYSQANGQVQDFGLLVTSTRDISLYASNFGSATFDIATILPTSTLGIEYMVQTWPNGAAGGAEVGFVATDDSTELTMTLPCATSAPSHSAGTTITQMLMRGQTFQMSAQAGQSFSGMVVTSNSRPFAMFVGHNCANVPTTNCSACDHVYEQMLPRNNWGRTFVLIPTAVRTGGDVVIVTSSENNNTINYDGTVVATLQAGQTHELNMPSGAAHQLNTSKPSMVQLMLKGAGCGGQPGDPAAVTVPPVEQGLKKVTFQALNTDRTTAHYVNIVTRTHQVRGMSIDNNPIDNAFTALNNGYSYAQLSVSPGNHTLRNSVGSFVAWFYGLGEYESYAYIAGMALRNLNNQLLVNGVDERTISDSLTACVGDTVVFEVVSHDTTARAEWWDNGVWLTNNQKRITQVFDSAGRHDVLAVVLSWCDTLSATVYVLDSPRDTVKASICINETYTWNGKNYDTEGFYPEVFRAANGCDSTAVLNLHVQTSDPGRIADSMCHGRDYIWHDRILNSPGEYEATFTSSAGCDSTVILTLTEVMPLRGAMRYESDCLHKRYTLHVDSALLASSDAFRWLSVPPDTVLEGHPTAPSPEVSPEVATLYTLRYRYHGCEFDTKMLLEPPEWPEAKMEVNPDVLTYDHSSFDAYDITHNNISRVWTVDGEYAGELVHLHGAVDPSVDSVVIGLTVYNGTCTDSTVRVLPVSHATVWIPTAFTPTGDEASYFRIVMQEIEGAEMSIYNREGLLMFRTDDPAKGWDGTHNGRPCTQGAYVWTLTYRTELQPTETQSRTGTVLLLR